MIANEQKYTTPRQRIVIVVIALIMLASMASIYIGIVLSAGGSSDPTASVEPQIALTGEEKDRYEQLQKEYSESYQKQITELSDKYYRDFLSYKDRVKAFNNADITELTYEDLKEGDGKVVDSEEFVDYSAYYIGWRTDEKEGEVVFDSSFDNFADPTRLAAPMVGSTQLVAGWVQGIQGMKVGGVREISMPAAYGYGSSDYGPIPANSALKFIVMLIPDKMVEPSQELLELSNKALSGMSE